MAKLSRQTSVKIVEAAWRENPKIDEAPLHKWCAVRTDLTGDRWFVLMAVGPEWWGKTPAEEYLAGHRSELAVGATVPLGALHTVPINDNLIAVIEPGVFYALGTQNDGLVDLCGPLVYTYCWNAKEGREHTRPPRTADRYECVNAAIGAWMRKGRAAAIEILKRSELFEDVFERGGGPGARDPKLKEWDA